MAPAMMAIPAITPTTMPAIAPPDNPLLLLSPLLLLPPPPFTGAAVVVEVDVDVSAGLEGVESLEAAAPELLAAVPVNVLKAVGVARGTLVLMALLGSTLYSAAAAAAFETPLLGLLKGEMQTLIWPGQLVHVSVWSQHH
jgi:hypothetical protein